MPKGFTSTTISLIPKTASPTWWSEYRPISLCNVTNKICTKLMTIRLGHVLPKVLSLSQSGFVPGYLLSDNVLLAQKLIHSLESRRPEANVVFKLDIAKAYNRVSWEFLYQAYERVSGQLINGMKSSFIVGRQVSSLQTQAVTLGEKPLAKLLHRDIYTMEPVSYYLHEGDWNVPRILRTVPIYLHRPFAKFLLPQRNAVKYRGVPFSTDDIILEVQRHLRTLYAART
ncbi:UNVERIFIED_CONTAM: hypothetical protein Scaly_2680000 [Sesamum calycinum]|uniref:Reverse transcriptase domain-containing protein n=1 Tax=Sesamum calycinum TaxID=2727403 RepID=A0AAW2J7G8_9LAMI